MVVSSKQGGGLNGIPGSTFRSHFRRTAMKKIILVVLSIIGLAGCGADGALPPALEESLASLLSGFSLPQSSTVSAVPTTATSTTVTTGGTATTTITTTKSCISAETKAKLTGFAKYSDPGTDYTLAVTHKFVEEPVLDQFEIVGEILDSLAQTHYSSEDNINKGPYRALVASVGESGGTQQKKLESWIVNSKLDQGAIIVQVWVEDKLILAEFRFSKPTTATSVGCGGWTVNAFFPDPDGSGPAGSGTFTLSVIEEGGGATYKMHERFEEGGQVFERKAIVKQIGSEGHGKVSFIEPPGPGSCGNIGGPCPGSLVTAKYAYNDTRLAVQKVVDQVVFPVVFKDRTNFVELNQRYGLFDVDTGKDILRTKTFGFPIVYVDKNGINRHGFYSAWQGRHQIHSDSFDPIPAGTNVKREDFREGQTAETFTTSALFKGIFSKRTVKLSDINILKNVPIEIYDNRFFNLTFDGTNWIDCKDFNFTTFPPTCAPGQDKVFTDFQSLVFNPDDTRRFVNIGGGFDPNLGGQPKNYACNLNTNTKMCDFFEAAFDFTGKLVVSDKKLDPAKGTQLFVNISGSIYIEYKGVSPDLPSGWVAKQVLSFDKEKFLPEFATTTVPFELELKREFYVHQQGTNYVLERTAASTYNLSTEFQTAINPKNVQDPNLIDPNWIFKFQFGGPDDSTYRFVTNPLETDPSGSSTYLKLVVKEVGPNDKEAATSTVVKQGIWGLVAHDQTKDAVVKDPTGRPIQFNWEFPYSDADRWPTAQYLKRSDGTFVFLSDPVRFAPLKLTDGAGMTVDYHLEYDGWLHGLPDFFREIEFNNFEINTDISNKVVNIADGTVVTDEASTTTRYVIKPLEVGVFMRVVPDPGNLGTPLASAGQLDLSSVPPFVKPNLPAIPPTVVGVKYSEGVKL